VTIFANEYAEAVERIVARGAVPTLGELAHLETLKAQHDADARSRQEQWGVDFGVRKIEFVEWSFLSLGI
jgi:hypothetical protein